MIRRHGAKSVRSSVAIENISARPAKRRRVLLSIPVQPLPYHQLNKSSINIVIGIVTPKSGRYKELGTARDCLLIDGVSLAC